MLGRLAFLVLALWAVAPGAQAQSAFTGSEAQFYIPPSPLPAGDQGTVIRWQRFDASFLLSTVGFGVDAVRVMYLSQDAKGKAIAVTGSILVPKLPYFEGIFPKTRPVVGFASGTQGMADSCAASHGFKNSTDYDILYVRSALEKGWAVAVSDYQGLGTPGEHTYVVGLSLGKSVLDSVRALYSLDAIFDRDLFIADLASVSSDAKVLLWGYSEGGNGASWANELNATYYPSGKGKLNVVATVAGGIPADIIRVGEAINRPNSLQNIAFGVLIAAGIGFDAAYPELKLKDQLTAEGLRKYDSVRTTCVVEHVLGNIGDSNIAKYTKSGTFNPLTDGVWRGFFQANSLGNKTPTVPTFMFHGIADEAVEFCQDLALARKYCEAGVRLQWKWYPGDHLLPYLQAKDDELNFFVDRLAGKSFSPTACSEIIQHQRQFNCN